MWIIDFGEMKVEEAALYEKPFEYVREKVRPERAENRRETYREKWWIHAEPRPAMKSALSSLRRFIVTIAVGKHRHFVWLQSGIVPDHALLVFARDDDYFFGTLHSRPHELWARKKGTQLREVESGFRYTPTSTFETYPLPWPPGREPTDDPRHEAIASAARELVTKRDAWLNPAGASTTELKKRTLTNLYNLNATWLQDAHRALDEAVFAAYGWPKDISDQEILARLLQLNAQRSATNP
jgi:hypothetical protein